MTPQSVDSVGSERRLVEEFYNLPVLVNPGLILAPLLTGASIMIFKEKRSMRLKSKD